MPSDRGSAAFNSEEQVDVDQEFKQHPSGEKQAEVTPRHSLTARQLEVLALVAAGASAKDVANRLNISVRTAEFHRAEIMRRLRLHSTALLTRYAVAHNVVTPFQPGDLAPHHSTEKLPLATPVADKVRSKESGGRLHNALAASTKTTVLSEPPDVHPTVLDRVLALHLQFDELAALLTRRSLTNVPAVLNRAELVSTALQNLEFELKCCSLKK